MELLSISSPLYPLCARESKGFAFVEFVDSRDARDAKDEMDRQMLDGRELQVVFAQVRQFVCLSLSPPPPHSLHLPLLPDCFSFTVIEMFACVGTTKDSGRNASA